MITGDRMAMAVSAGYALGVSLAGTCHAPGDRAYYAGLAVDAADPATDTTWLMENEARRLMRMPDPAATAAFAAVLDMLDDADSHMELFVEYITAVIGGLHRTRGQKIEITTRTPKNHTHCRHRIPDIAA